MRLIWALILFATIGFVKDASACSCGGTPFVNELRIGNGVIPENARGLGWHFTRAEEAGTLEELVRVTRLDKPAVDDGFIIEAVGFPSGTFASDQATVFVIRPNEWEIGARFDVSTIYESDEWNTKNRHFERVIFEIGEPLISFPEDIWVSSSQAKNIKLNEPSAVCEFEVFSAIATIGVSRISTNLASLHFETFVDDELYEPTSSLCEYIEPGRNWYRPHRYWAGFDGNRLVASCDPTLAELWEFYDVPNLTPGTHKVKIRASLPGTNIFFETTSTDVDLKCPDVEAEKVDMRSDDDNELEAPTDKDPTDKDPTDKDPTDIDSPDANDDRGGCSSIRSTPFHPIAFFLFLLGTICLRRSKCFY